MGDAGARHGVVALLEGAAGVDDERGGVALEQGGQAVGKVDRLGREIELGGQGIEAGAVAARRDDPDTLPAQQPAGHAAEDAGGAENQDRAVVHAPSASDGRR